MVQDSFKREVELPAIQAGFRRRLGAAVQVSVVFVPEIAPEKSGKFRYVISHVAAGQAAVPVATSRPHGSALNHA